MVMPPVNQVTVELQAGPPLIAPQLLPVPDLTLEPVPDPLPQGHRHPVIPAPHRADLIPDHLVAVDQAVEGVDSLHIMVFATNLRK